MPVIEAAQLGLDEPPGKKVWLHEPGEPRPTLEQLLEVGVITKREYHESRALRDYARRDNRPSAFVTTLSEAKRDPGFWARVAARTQRPTPTPWCRPTGRQACSGQPLRV